MNLHLVLCDGKVHLLHRCFFIAGVSAPSLPMAVGNGTTPTRNKTKEKSGKKGKGKLTKQDIGTPTDFRYAPRVTIQLLNDLTFDLLI